jgi:hypothetical protein
MSPTLRNLLLAGFAVWALALLYVLARPVGRYQMHDVETTTVVLDTRTGELRYYDWSSKEWHEAES